MSPATPKKPAARKAGPSKKRQPTRQPKGRPRKGPLASRLEELWFRASTRIRAAVYWLGERWRAARSAISPGATASGKRAATRGKAKPKGRPRPAPKGKAKRGKKGKESVLGRLGPRERLGLVLAGSVAALAALVLLVPLPLVPCSLSPAKRCPPPDRAIDLVPSDALLYAHLVREEGSEQLENSGNLGERIPDFSAVGEAVLGGLAGDSAGDIELGRDVLPWARREVALAVLPGSGGEESEAVFIAGVEGDGDAGVGRVEDLLEVVSRGPAVETSEVAGIEIEEYPGGLAQAKIGDFVAFGARPAVEETASVAAGDADALGPDAGPRGELPEQRFADIYVSGRGAKTLFGAEGGSLGQLGAFVDYRTTEGFSVALSAQDRAFVVEIVSDLSATRLKEYPNALTEGPGFTPTLSDLAPADALAFFGAGEVGPTLASVVETALGGELASNFDSIRKDFIREAGEEPLRDLLPALDGQAALILEPTNGPPEATLIFDSVDGKRASEALAELQQPLAAALASGRGGVPRFESKSRSGVEIHSLQGPSRIGLSYGIADGRLIISTTNAGVLRIIEGEGGLASTEAWRGSASALFDSPSALLFLDLQELTRLAELAGLAEDPLYAALSDDISNIDSVGVSIDGEPTRLRSRVVLDLR
ncbi:MAG: DUF3352 domain-containing protein [bacterium]